MPSTTFAEFRSAVFRHYFAGRYAEALARLDQQAGEFPDQIGLTLNWQACFQALTGHPDQALITLQQAVDRGIWYEPEQLRSDSDLASLQGDPYFERIVAYCAEQYNLAKLYSRPELRIIPPAKGTPEPYPMLLAIHGRGSNAAEAAEYWQGLAEQGWLVALPQSSQPVHRDAYGWDDMDLAESELVAHLERLRTDNPVDIDRIVLGGFSQGGGLSVYLTVTAQLRTRGFIAVAPYLRSVDFLMDTDLPGLPQQPRGWMITGGLDQASGLFQKLETLLQKHNIPYQRRNYPELAHEFPPDFATLREEAIQYILQ
jgi:predicted esterase